MKPFSLLVLILSFSLVPIPDSFAQTKQQTRPPHLQAKPLNPLPDKDYENVAENFFRKSEYILYIDGKTMEEALAQIIRFYERFGWAETDPLVYSGQALIYEEGSFAKDETGLPAEVRARHLNLAVEYLCTKARGVFRSRYLENRVLVVYKKSGSLLSEIPLPRIADRSMTVQEALTTLVQLANRQSRAKIYYERPEIIRLRAGTDPFQGTRKARQIALYSDLPPSILDEKITVNVFANKRLADGLAVVLAQCAYPLYLTLRPKDPSTPEGFSHVLRVGTLPAHEVEKIRIFNTMEWVEPTRIYRLIKP